MRVATLGTLAPDFESPREARRLVRALLDGRASDADVDDILLAVSELATNAVAHARTHFELRAGVGDAHIRVECYDGSARLPRREDPSPDDLGGRGLLLVEHLTDRWGVEPENSGKTIWFERALHRNR